MMIAHATRHITVTIGGADSETTGIRVDINPGDELLIEGSTENGYYLVTHVHSGISGLNLTEQEFTRA